MPWKGGLRMVPLGIDREKIALQLERLEEYLKELEDIKERFKKGEEDKALLPAVERLLQITTEECLNIGSHLIAGLGLKRADTYKEVFVRLKDAGIISGKLGTVMEEFASFRNRLVHLYYEVSRKEIISKLEETGFLREFAQQILAYLEKNQT